MKVAIHGSYFGDNFGDSLFVLQYVKYLNEIGISNEDIYLISAGSRIRNYAKVSSIKGLKAIKEANRIIFIGGGYFGERKEKQLIWHLRFWVRHISICLACIFYGKRYAFFGVGAGPQSNLISRKLSKLAVNGSEFFSARDKISFEFLLKIGVKSEKLIEVADSLISYPKIHSKENKTKKLLIHMPKSADHDNSIESILRELKNGLTEIHEVTVVRDFYKPSFIDVTERISKDIFKNIKVFEYKSPESLMDLICASDLVITIKLHVGILALTQGKFVISTYVHEKTPRFYAQMNADVNCFALKKLNEKERKRFKQVLKRYNKQENIQIPSELVEKSKENFTLLEKFIQ